MSYHPTLNQVKEQPVPTVPLYLTPRERQVIQGLAEDLSAKMIADRLDLSLHTVQQHIKKVKHKFGLSTSAGIVARALREGIIG